MTEQVKTTNQDAINKDFDSLLPPMPEQYKDWTYKDIRWYPQLFWIELLDALGDTNIVTLVFSKRKIEGETLGGGQFFISPVGVKILLESTNKDFLSIAEGL